MKRWLRKIRQHFCKHEWWEGGKKSHILQGGGWSLWCRKCGKETHPKKIPNHILPLRETGKLKRS